MNPQGAGAAQGAAVGQADLQDIIRNSFSTKFDYRGTETMATNVQRFLDGQARKSNASITSNVYNALMDTLGRADEANVSFLDSALSTVAVTNALANQDYNAALKALRESLLELEPNKQLTLVSFSNNLRLELSAAGKTGDPQAIYTAMVTGLKSIKRGSQQPDNNTLRELYFSNLDTNTQTIMIHTKLVHDRNEQSWQHFHRVVLDTLKEIPKSSQPQEVLIVEPKISEVAMLAKELRDEIKVATMRHQPERRERERDERNERRGRDSSPGPVRSKERERTRERERQNNRPNLQNVHRHRMCQRCPAGRSGRHLHQPQDCRYDEIMSQRDQRGGFNQAHRGGFDHGRGGFGQGQGGRRF